MGTGGRNIAENTLRQHRKALGLSLRQVAARLGLKDHAWICRWESGRVLPSLRNAARLSFLYEAPIEELFHGLSAALEEGKQEDSGFGIPS